MQNGNLAVTCFTRACEAVDSGITFSQRRHCDVETLTLLHLANRVKCLIRFPGNRCAVAVPSYPIPGCSCQLCPLNIDVVIAPFEQPTRRFKWRIWKITQTLSHALLQIVCIMCTCWHCPHSMHSRVYAYVRRPSVRPSVCLSVPSGRRTPLLQVCCCGLGG